MIKQPKFVVKFTNPQVKDSTVFYSIQIFDTKEDNQSWSFKARYSELRQLHQKCAAMYKKQELPDFPHRKLFGNTNPDFIQKRKKQLENYYNTLLKSVDLKELPDLLNFFLSFRPKVQKQVKVNTNGSNNKGNAVENTQQSQPKEVKIDSNKQKNNMKKIFEAITAETIQKMVDIGNDFYEEIIDDPRHKLPDGVQRAKYGPKSAILDTAFQNISEGKYSSNNEFDFWSSFFIDSNDTQRCFKTFEKAQNLVKEALKNQISGQKAMLKSNSLNIVMVL